MQSPFWCLKPIMTLVLDAQVRGPPGTPFPQEATQDSWCPFLCCPPEGLGKEQCTPLDHGDRRWGSSPACSPSPKQDPPAIWVLVSTSVRQEG